MNKLSRRAVIALSETSHSDNGGAAAIAVASMLLFGILGFLVVTSIT